MSVRFSTFGSERERDRGVDPVDAAACRFDDLVAGIVDVVDVSTRHAGAGRLEGVSAYAAVQDIGAVQTVQRVVEQAAGDDVVGALPVPTNGSASMPV